MVAVITGDIIASRTIKDQDKWLIPLKNLFQNWGERPVDWELDRGDFFQVEIKNPEEALKNAFLIKALIKKVESLDKRKTKSPIDIRMAIGIGSKTYAGETIKESNGTAFVFAGEKFDVLKKENINLAVKTPWPNLDEEINLYLKLAGIFMDKWTTSSAELAAIILKNSKATQEEIGKLLGIQQSGVSRRWNRAHIEELLEVEEMFRKKLKLFNT